MMNPWIPFLTALIWPVAIFILLTLYRRDVSTIIYFVRRRLERGDKFTLGGLTIESMNPDLGVQSVLSSEVISPRPDFILAATKANVRGKVLIATSAGFQGEASGLVGAGDVLGMIVLQSAFLASPVVKVETAIISRSYTHLADLIRNNFVFISVGGPYGNQLTGSVMHQVYTTFAFTGLTIYDRTKEKYYKPIVDDNTHSGKDWGLILSLPHPQYGPAGRAVVVAGCYGFGSQGAAMVLADIHEHKELWTTAENGCFEALLEVPIKNGQITTPKVIECRRFDAGTTQTMV
jgi:hypothetical protein